MSKKILIIDDDKTFVEAVRETLSANGYDASSASNGSEGLKKAKEDTIDLILLDVMMIKKTEGFEVARELSKNAKTKHIPIIMMTGIRKELNLPFGFEADQKWLPVKEVLEKPIKPQLLLQTIKKVLK